MPNILGMEGYKVLDRKEDQHDMVITAEFTKPE